MRSRVLHKVCTDITSCRSAIFCCKSILIVHSSSHLNDRETPALEGQYSSGCSECRKSAENRSI